VLKLGYTTDIQIYSHNKTWHLNILNPAFSAHLAAITNEVIPAHHTSRNKSSGEAGENPPAKVRRATKTYFGIFKGGEGWVSEQLRSCDPMEDWGWDLWAFAPDGSGV